MKKILVILILIIGIKISAQDPILPSRVIGLSVPNTTLMQTGLCSSLELRKISSPFTVRPCDGEIGTSGFYRFVLSDITQSGYYKLYAGGVERTQAGTIPMIIAIDNAGLEKMYATLNLNGNKITNLSNATVGTDALNWNTADQRYASLLGANVFEGNILFEGASNTFDNIPSSNGSPTLGSHLATKSYVDGVAGLNLLPLANQFTGINWFKNENTIFGGLAPDVELEMTLTAGSGRFIISKNTSGNATPLIVYDEALNTIDFRRQPTYLGVALGSGGSGVSTSANYDWTGIHTHTKDMSWAPTTTLRLGTTNNQDVVLKRNAVDKITISNSSVDITGNTVISGTLNVTGSEVNALKVVNDESAGNVFDMTTNTNINCAKNMNKKTITGTTSFGFTGTFDVGQTIILRVYNTNGSNITFSTAGLPSGAALDWGDAGLPGSGAWTVGWTVFTFMYLGDDLYSCSVRQ